jgi:hypothetical protein
MELVNGSFGAVDSGTFAPHLRLVFSEVSPQLAVPRGISKLCKALQRDAINDD